MRTRLDINYKNIFKIYLKQGLIFEILFPKINIFQNTRTFHYFFPI